MFKLQHPPPHRRSWRAWWSFLLIERRISHRQPQSLRLVLSDTGWTDWTVTSDPHPRIKYKALLYFTDLLAVVLFMKEMCIRMWHSHYSCKWSLMLRFYDTKTPPPQPGESVFWSGWSKDGTGDKDAEGVIFGLESRGDGSYSSAILSLVSRISIWVSNSLHLPCSFVHRLSSTAMIASLLMQSEKVRRKDGQDGGVSREVNESYKGGWQGSFQTVENTKVQLQLLLLRQKQAFGPIWLYHQPFRVHPPFVSRNEWRVDMVRSN